MEIIYPDNFIEFYSDNDDEIDEYELRNADTQELLDMIDVQFSEYYSRPIHGHTPERNYNAHGEPHGWYHPLWYVPTFDPPLWSTYYRGPYCQCPGPYCPCHDSSSIPEPYEDSYEYRSRGIPKQISDLSDKAKNIAGMMYDSFRPPFPPGTSVESASRGPSGPPPSMIPSKNDKNVKFLNPQTSTLSGGIAPKAVSPGSISFCLFRFTYIWQTNGRAYWSYLIRVDRQSISGFRWAGWRWVFFGVDLRKIEAFMC